MYEELDDGELIREAMRRAFNGAGAEQPATDKRAPDQFDVLLERLAQSDRQEDRRGAA